MFCVLEIRFSQCAIAQTLLPGFEYVSNSSVGSVLCVKEHFSTYWRIVLYLDLDNRKIIRKVNANKRCGWNRKKSFDPFHGSCLLLSQQWEQGCLQYEDISFFSWFFFLLLLLLFSALIRYLWAWDIPNRYQHVSSCAGRTKQKWGTRWAGISPCYSVHAITRLMNKKKWLFLTLSQIRAVCGVMTNDCPDKLFSN